MNKDYKREWAQKAARDHLRLMRGKSSDKAIGKLLGFSGTFINNVLKDEDLSADPPVIPDPVSQRLWDALIEKAEFKPTPPTTLMVDLQGQDYSTQLILKYLDSIEKRLERMDVQIAEALKKK